MNLWDIYLAKHYKGKEPFNIWDEEWELGYYDTSSGAKATTTASIRCVNFIKVIPEGTYYAKSPTGVYIFFYDTDGKFLKQSDTGIRVTNKTFNVPSNAQYMRFSVPADYGDTYNNDICINVSGSRNGQYEPYH